MQSVHNLSSKMLGQACLYFAYFWQSHDDTAYAHEYSDKYRDSDTRILYTHTYSTLVPYSHHVRTLGGMIAVMGWCVKHYTRLPRRNYLCVRTRREMFCREYETVGSLVTVTSFGPKIVCSE